MNPDKPLIGGRVERAARHWHLTLGDRLAGGTRSAVHAATDDQGRDLVLKVPEARADQAAVVAAEAAALQAWSRTGAAVSLVDATAEALLLVRSRPGTHAPWQPAPPLDELVGLAAELLDRLWFAEPGSYGFDQLADRYHADERIAREDAAYERRTRGEPDRGAAGVDRLPAAGAAAARLIETAPSVTLLHGDFITKNLVRDDAAPVGWVALDPLPMIGEPACEVAVFAAYQPAELIMPIAESLADMTGVAPRRALVWAAIWSVHQSAQAWRDDQAELDQLVTSAAIGELLRY